MTEIEDRWRDLGEFIREQRRVGQLSLRKLSEMAGISNPYLSQIERGMRKPSAEILRQIAGALHISAETLYVRAGILDERDGEHDLVADIRRDPYIDEDQKKTLVHIYLSFRTDFLADLEAKGFPVPVPGGARVAEDATAAEDQDAEVEDEVEVEVEDAADAIDPDRAPPTTERPSPGVGPGTAPGSASSDGASSNGDGPARPAGSTGRSGGRTEPDPDADADPDAEPTPGRRPVVGPDPAVDPPSDVT